MDRPIDEGRVHVNGVELAYLAAGGEGPLALCLHGFPDSAHTWRHLLPRLAGAGYRAVAPFTRGYAPSQVPPDGHYQVAALALDANTLHEALGGDGDAVLIGHDWGAPTTYLAANLAPERWHRLVGLAVPPGPAFATSFLTNPAQLKRSWYMFLFQHPLADLIVPADDLAFVDRLWADWSPGFDATEELALLKPSLRGPEHLAAALGYYRAAFSGLGHDPDLEALQAAGGGIPTQPLLYLHGLTDGCIGVEVADGVEGALAPGSRVAHVEDAGHFLHLERPDAVNDHILGFLS